MSRTLARRDERGVTLVVMALIVFMVLGMAALTIDHGMVKTEMTEAQRAMDAAALAGASSYMVSDPAFNKHQGAIDTAYKYALLHTVGGKPVLFAELDPPPVADDANNKVTVTFR